MTKAPTPSAARTDMHNTLEDDDWVMVDLITAPAKCSSAQDQQHAKRPTLKSSMEKTETSQKQKKKSLDEEPLFSSAREQKQNTEEMNSPQPPIIEPSYVIVPKPSKKSETKRVEKHISTDGELLPLSYPKMSMDGNEALSETSDFDFTNEQTQMLDGASITDQPLSSPIPAREPPLFGPYFVNHPELLEDDIQAPQGDAKAYSQYMTFQKPPSETPKSHAVLDRCDRMQRPPGVTYSAFPEMKNETKRTRPSYTRPKCSAYIYQSSVKSMYGSLAESPSPVEELFGIYKKVEEKERLESNEVQNPSQFFKSDPGETPRPAQEQKAGGGREWEVMEKEFEEWEKGTE